MLTVISTYYLMLQNWFASDEEGQDLAEYALLLGLIALVVVIAVTTLGTNLTTVFTNMAATVGGWF